MTSYPSAFSNRLFTTAAGALALSVTFKSNIAGTNSHYNWMLSLSWGLLTISILLQLTETLHKWAKERAIEMEDEPTADQAGETAFRAFRASIFCFALGIIALCLFAILNN